MSFARCSGILMPLSSLPGGYGIGSMGAPARKFVDFLAAAGQTIWQILPVGPTGYADSPYQSCSAFAGNPYFIDLDQLVKDGLLTRRDFAKIHWGGDAAHIDYGILYEKRFDVLRKAYANFLKQRPVPGYDTPYPDDWYRFQFLSCEWLPDYCLYMAIKRDNGMVDWQQWPEALRLRDPAALAAFKEEHAKEIGFWAFVQYEFDRQWRALHAYAKSKGVSIMGDIPIYVAADSADAWAGRELFETDADGNTVDLTDEQKQTAMDGAKTKADSMLAAVQAGTAFNTAAQDVLDETSAESYSDPEYNHKNDLGSALTSTYQSWLTDGSRKAGDITSIEVADTGYCVVQFLGRKKDDNSYQTLTYRNIEVLAETTPSEDENGTDLPTDEQLAAAKTKADDLLDQWKNGDATADSFGELAKTNSADETNKDNGGLNEDANRSSLDANLTDWLFAEGRQPGDAAVVEASDSSGNVIGYQILYVESLGEIQWKYQATTALRSDDYDKWYTEVEANYPAELTDLGKEIAASSSNQ